MSPSVIIVRVKVHLTHLSHLIDIRRHLIYLSFIIHFNFSSTFIFMCIHTIGYCSVNINACTLFCHSALKCWETLISLFRCVLYFSSLIMAVVLLLLLLPAALIVCLFCIKYVGIIYIFLLLYLYTTMSIHASSSSVFGEERGKSYLERYSSRYIT